MRITRVISGVKYYFGQFKKGIEWVFGWVRHELKAIVYHTLEGAERVACRLICRNHSFGG